MKTKNIIFGVLLLVFSTGQAQQFQSQDIMPFTTSIEIQTEFNEARIHFLNYFDDASYLKFDELSRKDPDFAILYLWKSLAPNTNDSIDDLLITKAEKLGFEATDSERAYIKIWRLSFDERIKLKTQYNTLKTDEEKTAFDWSSINDIQLENQKKLVALHPNDALLHIDYAITLAYGGRTEDAIEHYKKALHLNEEIYGVYNLLGYLYLDLEDFNQAEKEFDAYIAMMPEAANAYDSKGDYYFTIKDYKKAFKSYKKAYKIDPSFMISKEKSEEAKKQLRQ
jgi:tetratricopeptide (TPR) repeat protein